MAVVGPPYWKAGYWKDTYWKAGFWKSTTLPVVEEEANEWNDQHLTLRWVARQVVLPDGRIDYTADLVESP